MSNGNVNLPIVIQQSGDVSRVQEQAQRQGEQQQVAAGAEVAQRQSRERQSVQEPQRSGAQNRVRADSRQRGQERQAGGRRGRGQAPQPPEKAPDPERPGGGVVDVVV